MDRQCQKGCLKMLLSKSKIGLSLTKISYHTTIKLLTKDISLKSMFIALTSCMTSEWFSILIWQNEIWKNLKTCTQLSW